MELARRRWHGASEWTMARVVSALTWTTLLLVLSVLLPIERAEAVPSAYCPTLQYNVAYGGSQTQQIGYCDGGIFIGVGPTKVPPARGSVTYDITNDYVTYTHNGTGAQLTDQFVIDDGSGGDITINVTIDPPVSGITISPGSLGALQVGVPVSQQLTATGGTAPYTFALSASTMPPGLTLTSGGLISGTPSSRFTSTFTVVVTDNVGATAQQSYSVTPAGPSYTIDTLTIDRNAAVNATLVVRGGIPPYTVQYAGGTPPPGTSISTTGGTVSGTPTANGSYPLTMQVTDSSTGSTPYTANVAATIVVVDPPAITVNPASLPNGTVGASYTQTLTATGGTAPYTYTVTSGALPAGLVLNPSTGVLSGVPTEAGNFSPTVRATDNTSAFGSRTYSLTIARPVVTINPASLAAAQIGVSYSATISASGGIAPYTFSASGLPAGLTLATNGALTGTPTQAGSFTPTVTVTSSGTGDGAPFTDSRQYTLNVGGPSLTLAPAPGDLPAASYGQAYTATFTASGGTQPFTYTHTGTLPPGLTLSTGGVLSGTPTTPGSYNFFVYATDASTGTGSPFAIVESYTLVIAAPTISVSPAALPTPVVGTPYSQQVTASGGATPYTFQVTAGSLPPGTTLAGDGVLSGTPTGSGTFNATITATDTNGQTGAQAYTLTVASPTLLLSPPSGALPSGPAGAPYSQTFTASGGTAPYSYDALSALPTGLTLSGAGLLSGTPTVAGTFNITVQATDSTGGTAATVAQAYTLTIAAPSLTLMPVAGALPSTTAGTTYSQVFVASGGQAPYAYSVASGALPAGLVLSPNGTLSGVATAAGTFNVSVRAVDSTAGVAAEVVQAYTLQVAAPQITVTPTTLSDAERGTPYTASFSASGGVGTYSYTTGTGALPAGIALSTAGQLAGTPTVSGSFAFQVIATDALGFTGSVNLTLQVAENAPEVPDASVTTQAEQDGTYTVTSINGSPINSLAVVQQPANGQVTINGLTLLYSPNDGFAGTDSFRYTATGPGGTSQPATVTVNVVALPAPTVPDQAVSVLAGTAVSIDATAGASGGPFTAVTLVESPTEGTTVVQGTNVVYTAPVTASGATSVRYTVSNAYGASAPATATITVNPLPTAQPQQRDVIAGGSVQLDLTTGATGGPFTGANVIAVTPSTAGEVSVRASGQAWLLTFSPSLEFAGVATVSFTLDNAYATSAAALLTFNVTARTDPSRDAEVLGILDAQAATTRRFATTQLGNFQQRLERLHSAGEGGSRFQNGLGFQANRTCDPSRGSVMGDLCRDPAVSAERAAFSEPLPYTRDAANTSLALWTGGMISSGDADSRTGREGYDFETSGVSAGADYRLSPAFALGAGVGYGRDRTEVGVNGSRSDGDGYTMALYASWHPGRHLFVDWIAGYQLLGFENRRYVTDTGDMVSGKRDGSQWIASLSAGADFSKDRWQWSPYARLDAARARLDGYTETGTDSGHVLDFKRQDVDTTTVSGGLRMSYSMAVAWGRLSPQLRMEYQRELEDPSEAHMQYADLPGGPLYRAQVRGFDRNRFVFGAGFVLAAERDLVLRVEYRGLFGDTERTDHGIMFNLEKR